MSSTESAVAGGQARDGVPSKWRERLDWLPQLCAVLIASGAGIAVIAFGDHWSRRYYRNVVDDSLISMQYAKNLALGNGLVFNPGERVEGHTNFLWTVLCAPVYWVTRALHWDFVLGCVRLNLFIAAANCLLLYAIGRRLWQRRLLPLLAAVALLVVDDSYTVWAAMALESQLVSLCMLSAIALWWSEAKRRGLWTGVALAAMVMARPDAVLFATVFFPNVLFTIGWTRWRRGKDEARDPMRQWLWALAAFATLYGAYFAWRYSYYGHLLPNTFYLKVKNSHFDGVARGTAYVRGFVEERGYLALVPLASVLWIGNRTVRTVLLWLLLHVAYVVYVGGDFYPGHRFLLVTIPALGLLLGHVVFGIEDMGRKLFSGRRFRPAWGRWLVSGALLTGIVLLSVEWLTLGLARGPSKTEVQAWGKFVDTNKQYMLWLARRTEPGEVMLVGDIGSAAMYADKRVVDYYGVVDDVVAHQDAPSLGTGKPGHEKTMRFERAMEKKPKYIKFGYMHGDFWLHGYYFDTHLPPEFHQPGFWVRDDLAESGRYLPATRIGFEPGPYPGWAANGLAFENWPITRRASGPVPVLGTDGFCLSTFHAESGDAATGILQSAPLPLRGDKLVMRVAGGQDPDKLRVSLLVDGLRVASATGRNSDVLSREVFFIAPYKGKQGLLEVVDDKDGPWGHIIVDEIVQWVAR